jgi:hypothetical protein
MKEVANVFSVFVSFVHHVVDFRKKRGQFAGPWLQDPDLVDEDDICLLGEAVCSSE